MTLQTLNAGIAQLVERLLAMQLRQTAESEEKTFYNGNLYDNSVGSKFQFFYIAN